MHNVSPRLYKENSTVLTIKRPGEEVTEPKNLIKEMKTGQWGTGTAFRGSDYEESALFLRTYRAVERFSMDGLWMGFVPLPEPDTYFVEEIFPAGTTLTFTVNN